MKLSCREDVALPVDAVFAAISDFDRIERRLMRRGADIQRTRDYVPVRTGITWHSVVKFRGRNRALVSVLSRFAAGEGLSVNTVSGGLTADADVQLVPLARGRTRIILGIELRPQTLTARVLVQSLRIAKSSLEGRLSRKLKVFVREIEAESGGGSARA